MPETPRATPGLRAAASAFVVSRWRPEHSRWRRSAGSSASRGVLPQVAESVIDDALEAPLPRRPGARAPTRTWIPCPRLRPTPRSYHPPPPRHRAGGCRAGAQRGVRGRGRGGARAHGARASTRRRPEGRPEGRGLPGAPGIRAVGRVGRGSHALGGRRRREVGGCPMRMRRPLRREPSFPLFAVRPPSSEGGV